MTRYTLKGRALPDRFTDKAKAPCIFCARVLTHFNAARRDSNGWVVNGYLGGKACSFYYCHEPCPRRKEDIEGGDSIWRCGCVDDYIEIVGERCVSCGATRENAVPYE